MPIRLCQWAIITYLISDSIKILLQNTQGKLKAKWVLINGRIFLSWFDPAIKFWKNVIPAVMSCRIFDKSFNTFFEELINAEAKRLSTPNALSITLIICFSTSYNAEYVYIGTLLSTDMIEPDTLWLSLRELSEEASILKPAFFLHATSWNTVKWTMEIGY